MAAAWITGTVAPTVHLRAQDEGGEHATEHPHLGAIDVAPNPIAVNADLVVYTTVVFLALLFILWKFAWKKIAAMLDKREQTVADHLAAAARQNDEARQLLAQYETRLAAAQDEVRAILEEARRDAEHTGQEIVARARAEAKAEVDRGRRELETAKTQALVELSQTHARLAVDLAGKLIQSQLRHEDHTRLIEESMARFPRGSASPH
jgi:F-type H+-transporting ATPase subunit b